MDGNSLSITLSSGTLNTLKRDGYRFYVFRPVISSNRSGVPLVCQSSDDYLDVIVVDAFPPMAGYLSTIPVVVNTTVIVNASRPVSVGQIVKVSQTGEIAISNGTSAGVVQFTSQSAQRYTCGLAVSAQSQIPFCAFNLYAGTVIPISPLADVLVMFATSDYGLGAYMQTALGDGLYVKMADSVSRNVVYDIAAGWQTGQADWAYRVPAGSLLVESLIQRPQRNIPML